MASPEIITGSTTIKLNDYRVEVIPKWDQPKVTHTSVLTGKKTVIFKDSRRHGRLTVRIRVFDSDATIDKIEDGDTVTLDLYNGTTPLVITMIVKSFLPFSAGSKYGMRSSASMLLESEDLIANPITHV